MIYIIQPDTPRNSRLQPTPVSMSILTIRILIVASVLLTLILVISSAGCGSANWLLNGFSDPTQVGNFRDPVSLDIRDYMSILEEPLGIQDAEEPTADDMAVEYEAQLIGPGDFLQIIIFELQTPGLPTEQRLLVGNLGYVTIMMLGPIKVTGLTPRELELELTEQLRKAEILLDANVQVTILQSSSSQFTVMGQVPRPGNFPLPKPDFRLASALAEAGGVSEQAETLYVIRHGAAYHRETTPEESSPESPDQTASSEAPLMLSADGIEPPPTSRPVSRPTGGIDELEILEGKPRSRPGVPEFDPATGEWVIRAPADEPTSSAPADRPPENMPIPPDVEEAEEEATEDWGPMARVIEIPVKALMEGDPRYNIVIRPSDLINVPLGNVGEYFVGGNVARPGAYNLTGRRITVKQAIVSAGGFSPLAWPSRAELTRRVSKDQEQTIQIDLDAIFAGKAADFYLRPNDTLNVGSSPAATFLAVLRNAFRVSYGFGFVYDRNFADSDTFAAREQVKNRRRIEAQARGVPF